jgi:hypothetical protein
MDPATTPKFKMVKHEEGHAKANHKIAQKTGDRSSKMYESMLADIMEAFDANAFSDILNKQPQPEPVQKKWDKMALSNKNYFVVYEVPTDNLRPVKWVVKDAKTQDVVHKGNSSNLKAVNKEAEEWLATKSGATAASNHVTINFNAAFARQFAEGGETLWCDIWEGPMLVFSREPQKGFKKTVIRTPEHNRSQGAALLPVMGISPGEANKAGLDGNSRYTLGPKEDLGDGVEAYSLDWDSNVEKGERKIFKEPILQTSTRMGD